MQPILVAYATTEGHTRKVAEFIAERLRIRGHRVELVNVATPAAQAATGLYQAALIGGSVHQHKHQDTLVRFATDNREWLAAMPVGLFSVSLAAALDGVDGQMESRRALDEFVEQTGLRPWATHCVAGALKYTQYDYFKRLVMRLIAKQRGGSTDTSQDHEYTDWTDLEAFVDRFLVEAHVPGSGPR